MAGDVPIVEIPACESTQDDAVRMLEARPDLTAIAVRTDHQRSGRGREGREWHDTGQIGGSLLLSVAVRGPLEPTILDGLSVRAAELVRDVLVQETGLVSQVQPPNDLYVADRKLGGILVDTQTTGDVVTRIVIGIGVNLRGADAVIDGRLITSIEAVGGPAADPRLLAPLVADAIAAHADRYRPV